MLSPPGTKQHGVDSIIGRVNKANWKPCESCGRNIPVDVDWLSNEDGKCVETGTWTYVCPFCAHSHVGTPQRGRDIEAQRTCHECGAELGEHYQCPNCSLPRGWKRVDCPLCGNRQPVFMPHWVDWCDRLTWSVCSVNLRSTVHASADLVGRVVASADRTRRSHAKCLILFLSKLRLIW